MAFVRNEVAQSTFDFVQQWVQPRNYNNQTNNPIQPQTIRIKQISSSFFPFKQIMPQSNDWGKQFYFGIFTDSVIWAKNSDNGITSCCSTPKRRNVTVLSACSFSPTTAIIGVFANDNSRTL